MKKTQTHYRSLINRLILAMLPTLILCICTCKSTQNDPTYINKKIDANIRIPRMRSPEMRLPQLSSPRAKKGILDLYYWDFTRNGAVNLDGEWNFYRNHLLYPVDFDNPNFKQKPEYITVPGSWKVPVDPFTIQKKGFGTYRLVIFNIEKGYYGIKVNAIHSAYSIYVNGKSLITCGMVEESKRKSVPHLLPQINLFTLEKDYLDIIIQISNFDHTKSGIIDSIKFGPATDIIESRIFYSTLDIILALIFMVLCIYHLIVSILRIKYQYNPNFFIAALCFIIFLRIIVTGEVMLNHFFPATPWAVNMKLEYCTFSLGTLFFAVYFSRIYNNVIPKKILFTTVIFYSIHSVLVLASSPALFTYTDPVIFSATLIIMLYFLYILIKAFIEKTEYVLIVITGMLILTAAFINDGLNAIEKINTGKTTAFGLLIFIICESIAASLRFSKMMNYEQRLLKKSRKAQLAALLSKINTHFLFNTLNVIAGLIQQNAKKAEEVLEDFSKILHYNILFESNQFVTLDEEVRILKAYLNLESSMITPPLDWNIELNDEIRNEGIPQLILQPLLENCIKYNIIPYEQGGTITITIKKSLDNQLYIAIKAENYPTDEKDAHNDHTGADNPRGKGSGIALKNIRDRLSLIYADHAVLSITTEINSSITTLTIPRRFKEPLFIKKPHPQQ